MKTVFTHGGPNFFNEAKTEHLIQADQYESGKRLFNVTYGLQRQVGLTYEEACMAIGSAILHKSCCDGIASNEGA